eukprot:scaffold26252_cov137-Cylindrotheca_fusiformis.AAC.1
MRTTIITMRWAYSFSLGANDYEALVEISDTIKAMTPTIATWLCVQQHDQFRYHQGKVRKEGRGASGCFQDKAVMVGVAGDSARFRFIPSSYYFRRCYTPHNFSISSCTASSTSMGLEVIPITQW